MLLENMNRVLFKTNEKGFLSPLQQPYFLNQPPPPPPMNLQSSGFNLNNKVSPSVLLIIIILAIIFFVSGLLHLLVRFLLRPSNRDPDEMDNVTAFQGQLQQLFHLHDAGVDQSFIDTLPVFNYKAIIGVKDPFDCAVCLCEFEPEDKLRLLPKCSHAFHMECIDTWLLSHSTCPLCRASLLSDFPPASNNCSPIVFVLESGSTESSREIVQDRDCSSVTTNAVARVNSQLSTGCDDEFRLPLSELLSKSEVKEIENQQAVVAPVEKVVPVKLGKFRNVDSVVGEGSSNNNNINSSIDSRRCFSMGSFAYVMDDNTSLQVPIRTPAKKQSSKKPCLPLTPGHRPAISECGWDSRREFNGLDAFKILEQSSGTGNGNGSGGKAIGGSRRESFSVSKIWLRGKKDRPNAAKIESSRRAFSFRFPLGGDEMKNKSSGNYTKRSVSEIEFDMWENGVSELGCDEEMQSCNSLDSQPNAPSFARKTLLWLMGRQNKVVHSNVSSNV